MVQEPENLYQKYMNTDLETFSIPINSNVPQRFTHRFNNGRIIIVKIRYNKPFQNWVIDFYEDGTEETPLVLGVELNFGLDLLSSFGYKELGEFYVFPMNPREYTNPTYNDLNTNFYYIWRHN